MFVQISRLTFWTRYGSECSLDKKEAISSDEAITSVELQPMNRSSNMDIKENENFVVQTQNPGKGCLRKFFTVICRVKCDENDVSAEQPQQHHLRSLKQSYLQRKLLGLGFIVSCSIGVGMYIFWSLPE